MILDQDFAIGETDPRLFGGFAEHLGRCVYGGMFDPDHPSADGDGFRTDVLDLLRELDMPVMRYPGGNFVSGYDWEDGVGPAAERPRRLDPAWKTTETNRFGTDEFVRWCRKAGTEPMLAVNLGTRGPDAARKLVEYCNHPGGAALSDLRRANGAADPHGIRLWCLGNEMDGPWQMGHKTATEYGRIACEAAKLMKWTDPEIELVVCGSSGHGMQTFGAWELEVLAHTLEHVDYLSLHAYYGNGDDDTPRFLACPDEMDTAIEETVACCDAAAARQKTRKRLMLSFDEWNVWYHSHKHAKPEPWAVAPPLLEDAYTAEDALTVGGMLVSLLNHCDRVKIGCIAQIVNVIAPIRADPDGPAWRQSIFHPFRQASMLGRGRVLQQAVESPRYDCKTREGVPVLKAACVHRPDADELVLFLLNRDLEAPLRLETTLRGFDPLTVAEWTVLRHDDLKAVNSREAPETVVPVRAEGATCTAGTLRAELPPASWNVLRLRPAT